MPAHARPEPGPDDRPYTDAQRRRHTLYWATVASALTILAVIGYAIGYAALPSVSLALAAFAGSYTYLIWSWKAPSLSLSRIGVR